MIAILGPIEFNWAIEPNRPLHFDFFQIPNESNRTLLNTLDCVRLGPQPKQNRMDCVQLLS